MESIRWVVGQERDGSDRLFKALATLGFKVSSTWRYPAYPTPFDVPFTNGRSEIFAEFETAEGVVVSGPAATIHELREIYDRPPESP
jgi:hypothetical protein